MKAPVPGGQVILPGANSMGPRDQRGEVTADTNVGALLPLGGTPIDDVTLAELASHRSGLSAQGMHLDDTIPFALRYLRHRDPSTQDVDGVLAIARKATLTD